MLKAGGGTDSPQLWGTLVVLVCFLFDLLFHFAFSTLAWHSSCARLKDLHRRRFRSGYMHGDWKSIRPIPVFYWSLVVWSFINKQKKTNYYTAPHYQDGALVLNLQYYSGWVYIGASWKPGTVHRPYSLHFTCKFAPVSHICVQEKGTTGFCPPKQKLCMWTVVFRK